MQQLNDILQRRLRQAGIAQRVTTAQVISAVPQVLAGIIPASTHSKVQALYIKDKVLTIACLSSVLAQELRLHQQQIIDGLNEKFGQSVVESIRFLT